MNKEESKKYLDIVKNGNYDDMFDFGCEITKQDSRKKIEGMSCPEGVWSQEVWYKITQDILDLLK